MSRRPELRIVHSAPLQTERARHPDRLVAVMEDILEIAASQARQKAARENLRVIEGDAA